MTAAPQQDNPVAIILKFFDKIGLPYLLAPVENGPVMPGLTINDGVIIVDRERLLFPGDLLHEAGHVATMPPSGRPDMNGKLGKASDMEQASEIIAQAWSYAACLHLGFAPSLVFHEHGYRGSSQNLIERYGSPFAPGVPLLAYYGMTCTPNSTEHTGVKPFPHMISWINVSAR